MSDLSSQSSSPRPASPPSGSADAERLLRSALERLVLLECRTAAEESGSDPAEVDLLRKESRRAEARASAAEAQRDRLFAQLLEAERVRASMAGQSTEVGQLDLASFIAELRSELAEVQRARDVADRRNDELSAQLRKAQSPTGPRSALEWAAKLRAEGLLFREDAPLGELWPELCAGTPAERLVLAGVVRDLDSDDTPLRESACQRLAALPPALAAPVVAAALGREQDPLLLGKLLRLGGRLGVVSLLPLVERELDHADDRVRAAALLACLRLGAVGDLDAWTADQSPRVRRGAAIAAALRLPERALPVLDKLSQDPDAGVRKLAAGCAATLSALPEQLLRRFGNDEEPAVRQSALRALQASPEIAKLPAAERRRRLKIQPAPQRRPEPVAVEGADTPALPSVDLLPDLERELRASLRGRTPQELGDALGHAAITLEHAIARGLAEGRLIRRGQKIYVG